MFVYLCLWSAYLIQSSINQVGLGVGIPVTFLLTAIIPSLVASFTTYLCLTRDKVTSHNPRSSAQKPVYEFVPPSKSASVEMMSNAAYGHVRVTTTGEGHKAYVY